MVKPAAIMSGACKKVIRPSGPMGTSFRWVSGISKRERLRVSPAPSVRCSAQWGRLEGAVPERARALGFAGGGLAALLSAAEAQVAPNALSIRQKNHLRRESLFI